MAASQELSRKLKETMDLAARSFEAEKSEGYQALSEELEELETAARDSFQSQTDYKTIVYKLENGVPLTSDEFNTLKLLLVGDAEYYTKFDDDFERSESDLKKILDEIRKLQSRDLDIDAMMHLRVLCREACSVARPTAFYLEQKERTHKFEDATRNGIDRESGQFLADTINRMMHP